MKIHDGIKARRACRRRTFEVVFYIYRTENNSTLRHFRTVALVCLMTEWKALDVRSTCSRRPRGWRKYYFWNLFLLSRIRIVANLGLFRQQVCLIWQNHGLHATKKLTFSYFFLAQGTDKREKDGFWHKINIYIKGSMRGELLT